MADFKKYNREKIKEKIKSKRMFITGSSRDEKSDTVLTSSFNEMSKSFANNSYLASDGTNSSPVGGLIYMMNEMQEDISDLHLEISQSVYVAQISELSTISTASIGIVSSSLTPNLDNTYDLGKTGAEWKDLYIDGTANVDAINLNGTAISVTAANINSVTGKLDSTGGTISGPLGNRIGGFSGGDTTPSVNGGNVFVTANTKSSTSITFFDNGIEGQEITIIILDTNTTFVHSTKFLLLNGARNVTLATGDTITFVFYKNKWYEKCRSDNT